MSGFQAGGVSLKLLWYGFMLTAVLLAPLAVLLSQVLGRDGLAIVPVATVIGVLAAVVQFLGLARWPFLVPTLARKYDDPASSEATPEATFVVFESFHTYSTNQDEDQRDHPEEPDAEADQECVARRRRVGWTFSAPAASGSRVWSGAATRASGTRNLVAARSGSDRGGRSDSPGWFWSGPSVPSLEATRSMGGQVEDPPSAPCNAPQP